MAWQLQTAKQKVSELVERALADGPQVVTRRGQEVVVLISMEDYRRLRDGEPDFKRFLLNGPGLEDLEIERSAEPAREIEL